MARSVAQWKNLKAFQTAFSAAHSDAYQMISATSPSVASCSPGVTACQRKRHRAQRQRVDVICEVDNDVLFELFIVGAGTALCIAAILLSEAPWTLVHQVQILQLLSASLT